MVRPRRVDDPGRPQDGLPGRDPLALLADEDPAAAFDDHEPGRVRIGVGSERATAGERQLGDDPAVVGVDDLTGEAGCPGRSLGSPVADPEASDLDGSDP